MRAANAASSPDRTAATKAAASSGTRGCVKVRRNVAPPEGGFHAQLAAAHRRLVVRLEKASTTKLRGEVDQHQFGFGLRVKGHAGHALRQLLQKPVDLTFKE